MRDWKETTLGEVVTLQRGHDLLQTEFEEGAYLVAGSNGPMGYHSKFTTKGPGVTVGRSGNSIGVAHFYAKDFWAHNTVLYVKEFHNSHPKFVYFLLKAFDFKSFDGGSAVPTLNRNHLHLIPVKIPLEVNEQIEIADILSSLDDKIDLLHRQNKTLEQLAETLFRQWFVEEAEESWADGVIGDVASFFNGKVRPNAPGKIPIYGGNGILGYTNVFNYSGKSIIVGRVGAYCGSLYYEDKEIWVSDNALVVKPKTENMVLYLFYLLKTLELNSMAEGSSHPLITQTLLKSIEIVLPPKEKIERFHIQVQELRNKIEANNNQIHTLTHLRDTLLPKLMSGEVRVKMD